MVITSDFGSENGGSIPPTVTKLILVMIFNKDEIKEITPTDVSGRTSFHNTTITTTAEKLSKLFGQWKSAEKQDFYWNCIATLNDDTFILFTIYSWKELNPTKDEVLEFHIGTEVGNKRYEQKIKSYLEKQLKNE